jgi:diguanylate cyclase (GGDEF)-like protein
MSNNRANTSLWLVAGLLILESLVFFVVHSLLDQTILTSLSVSLGVVLIVLVVGRRGFVSGAFGRGDLPDSAGAEKAEITKLQNELKSVTKKLQKQIYDLHNLFEVSINLTSILEPQQLIQSSMLSLIGQLQTNQTIVFLPTKGDERSIQPVYSKGYSKRVIKGFSLSLDDTFIRSFGEKIVALNMLDVKNEFHTGEWKKLVDNGVCMVAPIISKSKIRGLLAVGQKMSKENFTRSDQELFSLLAHFISVAFSNSILYQRMEQISITDGLTGLYNYRYFKKRLEDELMRARRYEHYLSLVLFDVDHFKNFNDTQGHPAGDVALKQVADILQATIRKSDIAVRYGGEEFCVILPEGDRRSAFNFAERLRKQIEAHHFRGEEQQPGGRLTVSLGVASFPGDAHNLQELIDRADVALYEAKNSGRNATRCFNEIKV